MRSLDPDIALNLADEGIFLQFASNPGELRARLGAHRKRGMTTVFVDEIQRLPSLLNTVQAILDESEQRYRFLLTGSSARKLRRGNANLLPGRVHGFQLGPIVAGELNYRLLTDTALSTGTLPGILTSDDPRHRQKTLSS